MEQHSTLRVGANAVIIRNDALLLVEFGAGWRQHFNLPGGGIEPHEAITTGLQREVREETCAEVTVGPLLLVLDYFPPYFDHQYGSQHKVSLFFRCDLHAGSEPRCPQQPDPHQVSVQWVPLDELPNVPLIPAIANHIIDLIRTPTVSNPFRERL